MKNKRKNAANVRAIKKYWLKKAQEIKAWLDEAYDDLEDSYNAPVEDNNWYGHDWQIEQCQKKVDMFEGMLKNAFTRYEQAIPSK